MALKESVSSTGWVYVLVVDGCARCREMHTIHYILTLCRYLFSFIKVITIWENEGVIGESQLQFFAFNPDHKWRNAGLLCVLIVGFRLLSWIFLKFRSADKLKGN
jgi:hypothetical protein